MGEVILLPVEKIERGAPGDVRLADWSNVVIFPALACSVVTRRLRRAMRALLDEGRS
jgi:hypothetical protein